MADRDERLTDAQVEANRHWLNGHADECTCNACKPPKPDNEKGAS